MKEIYMAIAWVFCMTILITTIHGCTANQDLDDIAAQKKDCIELKKKFDEVKPKENTFLLNTKIAGCKKQGAWD